MKKLSFAIAALLIAAAPARMGGGKISWTEPKNPKEFDALVARSNDQGKAIFLYFTMDG